MLPLSEPASAYLQAVQVIALSLIAAWVRIYGQRYSASVVRLEEKFAAEKERCDELERRVKTLERKRRHPPKPRPKK
jgi:hypothetical protein